MQPKYDEERIKSLVCRVYKIGQQSGMLAKHFTGSVGCPKRKFELSDLRNPVEVTDPSAFRIECGDDVANFL